MYPALLGCISSQHGKIVPPPPPVAGSWSLVGSLNEQRQNHTATLLDDGRVLIVGGQKNTDYSGVVLCTTCEIYDPSNNTCSTINPLNHLRYYHKAAKLANGKVLIFGGNTVNTTELRSELFDPSNGSWTVVGSLPSSDVVCSLFLPYNGKVMAILSNDSKTSILFDPNTNTWSTSVVFTNQHDILVHLTSDYSSVIAIGASSNGEMYDVLGNYINGIMAGAFNTVRYYASAVPFLSDVSAMIIGGYDGNFIKTCEKYTPQSESWAYTGEMTYSKRNFDAILLNSTKVIALPDQENPDKCEIYDKSTGLWNLAASLSLTRYNSRSVLLNDGSVLITGGSDPSSYPFVYRTQCERFSL